MTTDFDYLSKLWYTYNAKYIKGLHSDAAPFIIQKTSEKIILDFLGILMYNIAIIFRIRKYIKDG